jgi:hypothetical protein
LVSESDRKGGNSDIVKQFPKLNFLSKVVY